jgi:maltooligosyltrehalose trehalohydrolase
MPFGAEILDDGVRFALWAPTAEQVALVLDGTEHPLDPEDGWYRTVRPARAGSRYGFRIDGNLLVPDPASRFQPDDVHRESMVVDPRTYAWQHHGWQGRPWEETVLYEVHVGTATPEGTYAGLEKKLEELRDLGVTAIELLPLAEFPGKRNWGYDGVLPFAPDAAYGTPEDLKRLIDRAHGLGLMIFIDAVYNHFGPSGNYLHAYAKQFFNPDVDTPWGAAINFANPKGRDVVRDFFVNNALYWVNEFHVDGLRFDAVHAFKDDSQPHFIEELARRIRQGVEPGREVHLVLENEANEARWLNRDESRRPILHTAQWADDIHNCWHPILTGESEGYYESFADKPVERLGRALAEGFAFQGDISKHHGTPRGEPSAHLPPTAFVSFLQNHDQVGNRAFGERLSELVDPKRLSLARALFLLAPQIPLLFQGEDWAATSRATRTWKRPCGKAAGGSSRTSPLSLTPIPTRASRTPPPATRSSAPASTGRRPAGSPMRRRGRRRRSSCAFGSGRSCRFCNPPSAAGPTSFRIRSPSTCAGLLGPGPCASSRISATRPSPSRRRACARSGSVRRLARTARRSTCRPGRAPSSKVKTGESAGRSCAARAASRDRSNLLQRLRPDR